LKKRLGIGALTSRTFLGVATGATLEQARRSIAGAIEFHVEGLKLRGCPVPEPVTRAEEIEAGSVAA
jgi:predicted RNase H-like HicB family nuclease